MESEKTPVQAPDISQEEMKMPENARGRGPTVKTEATPVNGVIIVMLALLLVLILGGMYYWFSQLSSQITPALVPSVERPSADENNEPESTTAEAAVTTQGALSPSNEIIAIEADLSATSLSTLDSELQAIDAELEAALSE